MGDWHNGLFGCFTDVKLCILTYFAPCYTAGKIGEAVGEDGVKWATFSLIPLVNWYCLAKLRGKVREKKAIEGSFPMDCLLTWCCLFCALHQEAAEMGAVDVQKLQEGIAQDVERV